jgi:hypothetical protein
MPVLHLIQTTGPVLSTHAVMMPNGKEITKLLKATSWDNVDMDWVLYQGRLRVMWHDMRTKDQLVNKRASRLYMNMEYSKTDANAALMLHTLNGSADEGDANVFNGPALLWEGDAE